MAFAPSDEESETSTARIGPRTESSRLTWKAAVSDTSLTSAWAVLLEKYAANTPAGCSSPLSSRKGFPPTPTWDCDGRSSTRALAEYSGGLIWNAPYISPAVTMRPSSVMYHLRAQARMTSSTKAFPQSADHSRLRHRSGVMAS